LRRLVALCRKESLQIVRDPSSILIAFVLPVVLLFIFGYGINLDSTALRVGLVMEDQGPEARDFAASLAGSPYLRVIPAETRREAGHALTRGRVRGFVIIPPDFSENLKRAGNAAPLMVVTDGAEPNTASFVENYVRGAWQGWQEHRGERRGEPPAAGASTWNRVFGSILRRKPELPDPRLDHHHHDRYWRAVDLLGRGA
jgi:ABC-2 type transport system permease protein